MEVASSNSGIEEFFQQVIRLQPKIGTAQCTQAVAGEHHHGPVASLPGQNPWLLHVSGRQNVGWLALLDPFAQHAGWSENRRCDRLGPRRKCMHHVCEGRGQAAGGINAQRLRHSGLRDNRGRQANQYAGETNELAWHRDPWHGIAVSYIS